MDSALDPAFSVLHTACMHDVQTRRCVSMSRTCHVVCMLCNVHMIYVAFFSGAYDLCWSLDSTFFSISDVVFEESVIGTLASHCSCWHVVRCINVLCCHLPFDLVDGLTW